MLITRTSLMSGITRKLDIPVTEEQVRNWENGMLAQLAMPNLTPGQREFIISGCIEEEWVEAFGDEE